ncbi:MAG: apolipoprotein N-acyltransferase [Rhodobacteraceae bacterium]|nr:apolipoprotein N-acyltransferase [Paracoccaceae bacterium]
MLIFRPKNSVRWIVALACGGALALGQAPFNFPYLALVAIPVLLSMLQATAGKKAAFKIGWLAGFGYFLFSLFWIIEPLLVDVAADGWAIPFAITLMPGGLAIFWGLAFALSHRWMRGNISDVVVLAGFWALAEVLRSVVFTGFPWNLLAYGWVETPIIQVTSLIGVHGLGFLIVLVSGLLLWRRGMVISLIIAAVVVGLGVMRLAAPVAMTDLTVRLVQPNAEQHLKWQPDQIPVFYQRQLALSAEGPTRPDVVIWPEVAIAYLPDEQPELRHEIVSAAGAPVILGARRRDATSVYNSLFVIGENAEIAGQYDKYHLVPFGEYMPLQGLANRLGFSALANIVGSMGVGDGPKIIDTGNLPPFLPMICYEAIFPSGLFAKSRADWLVHITNDAWFGKFSGPYQHLAQSRVRAIEQGLPLARTANTGISAMIDPYGRVLASLPLGTSGYVDSLLPSPLPATLFVRTGPWLAVLIIVLILTGQLIGIVRRSD